MVQLYIEEPGFGTRYNTDAASVYRTVWRCSRWQKTHWMPSDLERSWRSWESRGAWQTIRFSNRGSFKTTSTPIQTQQNTRPVGGQALSLFLSSALGTPAAEIACDCGDTLHYQRRRPATIPTVFGKITYERAYYAGC